MVVIRRMEAGEHVLMSVGCSINAMLHPYEIMQEKRRTPKLLTLHSFFNKIEDTEHQPGPSLKN